MNAQFAAFLIGVRNARPKFEAHLRQARADARRWEAERPGDPLAALRARDYTTLARWANRLTAKR